MTKIENWAEEYVLEFEKKRTGTAPQKIKSAKGYDFDSVDRHIEVKGKEKTGTTWLQLTANETDVMIHDPLYFLYLVEKGEAEDIHLYIIPQPDLLSMTQLKIHARLTRLANTEKRKQWLFEEKKPEFKF